jgi:ketosteroid isomerase-like protein
VIAARASDAPPSFGYQPPREPWPQALANLELSRRYLAAIEAGAIGADLAAYFAADVEQIEYPNRLVPTGARRDLAALLDGAVRGQAILRAQRYQVDRAYAEDNVVVLEVLWVGMLAVAVATLAPGSEMRAHFAVVLEIMDGRIRRQRNYDCFDAF